MQAFLVDMGGRIGVRTPYRPATVELLKLVPTSRWDREKKVWTFSCSSTVRAALRDALADAGIEAVDNLGLLSAPDDGFAPPAERPSVSTSAAAPAPWPHQVEAVHWIGGRAGSYVHGGMGVGKSRVVVDAIATYDIGRTLILCPSSVVPVWPGEFAKYGAAGTEVLDLWRGSIRDRTERARRWLDVMDAEPRRSRAVVVVNYEAAWREPFASWSKTRKWDLIVLDEAHRIKEARGKQSSYCEDLRDHAARVVGMSGTPMPHSPLDVFAQFRAIDPGVFGTSLVRFRSAYEASYFQVREDAKPDRARLAVALDNDEDFRETWNAERDWPLDGADFRWDMSIASRAFEYGWSDQDIINLLVYHRRNKRGQKDLLGFGYYITLINRIHEKHGGKAVTRWKNLEHLRERMDVCTMRIKREVLDLPDAVDCFRYLELDTEERRVHDRLSEDLYAELQSGEVTAANALTRLLRLQQATGGFTKTDAGDVVRFGDARIRAMKDLLGELAREADEDGVVAFDPVVVFCRFHPDLDAVGFAAQEVTGQRALELSGRRNELAEWQQDGAPPVLAVQIQAGGLGVSMVRAATAIYYSIGFSLGDLEQAKARVHRPGQRRSVNHVFLVARDTIDEHLYGAISAKRDVVQYVLDGVAGQRRRAKKGPAPRGRRSAGPDNRKGG